MHFLSGIIRTSTIIYLKTKISEINFLKIQYEILKIIKFTTIIL